MASSDNGSGRESLPPSPPIPTNVVPTRADEPRIPVMPTPPSHLPICRPGVGAEGHRINLLSNHFNVRFNPRDKSFYHYSVSIKSDDMCAVEGK